MTGSFWWQGFRAQVKAHEVLIKIHFSVYGEVTKDFLSHDLLTRLAFNFQQHARVSLGLSQTSLLSAIASYYFPCIIFW